MRMLIQAMAALLMMFQLPNKTGGVASAASVVCHDLVCGSEVVAPVDNDFSWVNQGTATKVATTDYVAIQDTDLGSDNIRGRVVPLPAAPYVATLGFKISALGGTNGSFTAGMLLRQSSDGKLIVAGTGLVTSTPYLLVQKFTNVTTYSANVLFQQYANVAFGGANKWVRVVDNNTNRIFYFSSDGKNWTLGPSEARTTFMTADQIGFFLNAYDSNATITVVHWQVQQQ